MLEDHLRRCCVYLGDAERFRLSSLLMTYRGHLRMCALSASKRQFDWWDFLFVGCRFFSGQRLPLAELVPWKVDRCVNLPELPPADVTPVAGVANIIDIEDSDVGSAENNENDENSGPVSISPLELPLSGFDFGYPLFTDQRFPGEIREDD